MAFKAALEMDGVEYTVENCNFSMHQETDHRNNKPTAHVAPSSISMEIKVDKKKMKELWKWGILHHEKKTGTVKFYKVDEDASMFDLAFEDGFCTSFSYQMSSHGSSDMTVSIDISCRKLELDGDGFELEW